MRSAFIFLTRIPVGGFPFSQADFRWSSAHFPLVGAVLGALMFGVFAAVAPAGHFLASAFAVVATLLVTGAFHEDGLADSADALGGTYNLADKARVFTILKDSRVGSFGAAALAMALLIRVGALSQFASAHHTFEILGALVLTQSASRWVPLLLMRALPYVTEDDNAKSKHMARAGGWQLLTATVTTLLCGVFAVLHDVEAQRVAAVLVAGVLVAVLLGFRFARRLGGITGDFLGATQQVSECVFWVVLLWERP
jgi:adenosylcobinamide-GDP ribazoletransferase